MQHQKIPKRLHGEMMPRNNDGSQYQAGLVDYTNSFIRKVIEPNVNE